MSLQVVHGKHECREWAVQRQEIHRRFAVRYISTVPSRNLIRLLEQEIASCLLHEQLIFRLELVKLESELLNSTHVQIHGLPVTVALLRVCSVLGRDNGPWQPGRFDQELLLAGLLEKAEEVDTFVHGSTHCSQSSAKDMRNDNSHVRRP